MVFVFIMYYIIAYSFNTIPLVLSINFFAVLLQTAKESFWVGSIPWGWYLVATAWKQ